MEFALYSLEVISDHEFLSPSGQIKILDLVLPTRLPKEFKKMVILTFRIEKLSPSNLGGQLMRDLPLYAMSAKQIWWLANKGSLLGG